MAIEVLKAEDGRQTGHGAKPACTRLRTSACRFLLSAFWFLSCTFALGATKEEILASMEAAGRKVTNFSATISQKKWTAVLQEFDRGESGTLWYLRSKDGQAYLRKEIANPENNVLVISNGEVIFYEPRIKQARKYQLGKNKDKAEFLVLGFGSSSRSLSDTYNIRLLGEEKIDGKRTYMLELLPKSEKVAAYFSQIVLWVAELVWLPIQQKLIEPNGDYQLITFSDLRLNPGVDKSKFKLTLPKDVQLG
ncbi:MAG: outer membrane lipoprotein carrier protein LolA [Acidobacteria bacterium]|nr:outer membrane lipoprotein carrier protein LolA [Acidobacteriota bacterium]